MTVVSNYKYTIFTDDGPAEFHPGALRSELAMWLRSHADFREITVTDGIGDIYEVRVVDEPEAEQETLFEVIQDDTLPSGRRLIVAWVSGDFKYEDD